MATPANYQEECSAIQARDLDLHWEDLPRHYIPDQPVATHMYDVMHLLLPQGEGAMSAALAQALPHIDDPRLHEEVVGFVGQEATHAQQHGNVRERLVALGTDPTIIMERLGRFIDVLMTDRGSPRVQRALLCERLALFAALEHYTAIWGVFFLESRGLADSGIHPGMLDLLRWHGAEEVEHRSVVFDAYMHLDGGYFRRVRAGVMGSFALFLAGLMTLAWLVNNDPEIAKSRNPVARRWRLLRELRQAERSGTTPSLFGFLPELRTYLRRDYHPSQLRGMDLAVRYLATAPIKAA